MQDSKNTTKTIDISVDPFRPLQVEYFYHLQHYVVINGVSVQQPQTLISLLSPASGLHEKTRILNMSAQTFLNLLDWGEQDRTHLLALAKIEAVQEQQRKEGKQF